MSAASRKLDVGDEVVTDYTGRLTRHRIIERVEFRSQSGIGFRVAPLVKGSSGGPIDADWFEPFGKQDSAQEGGAA